MKILIKNGRVLNPATNMDTIADVLVEDGKGRIQQDTEEDHPFRPASGDDDRGEIHRHQNHGNQGPVEMLLSVQKELQHIDQAGCRRQNR